MRSTINSVDKLNWQKLDIFRGDKIIAYHISSHHSLWRDIYGYPIQSTSTVMFCYVTRIYLANSWSLTAKISKKLSKNKTKTKKNYLILILQTKQCIFVSQIEINLLSIYLLSVGILLKLGRVWKKSLPKTQTIRQNKAFFFLSIFLTWWLALDAIIECK